MKILTVYDQIARTFVKSVKCSYCREPVRRQRTFSQRVRPGRDREQIARDIAELGAAWQAQPELCGMCEKFAEAEHG
jgi:hypothetical protein